MRAIPSRLQLVAWLVVTLLTVWSWRTAPTPPQPDWDGLGVSFTKGRVYCTDGSGSRALDVYLPAQASNTSGSERLRPAVIAVHGGSWSAGSMTAFRYDPRHTVI